MCRLAPSAPRGFGLCGWAERVVGSQAAVLPAAVRSQLLSQEAPLRPRRPLSVPGGPSPSTKRSSVQLVARHTQRWCLVLRS